MKSYQMKVFVGKLLPHSLSVLKDNDHVNVEIYILPSSVNQSNQNCFEQFDTTFCQEDMTGFINSKNILIFQDLSSSDNS